MRSFDAVARAYGCTIVLIGHNNRNGDFSGSTAFENAVRARISLEKAEADDGEEVVRLKLPKANYHGKDQIDMQYRAGCFVAVSEEHMTGAERLERDMRRSQAEARFLEGVDKLTAMEQTLSPSNRARNYAPKLIREKHAPTFTVKELDAAMWRLLEEGRLVEGAKLPFKKDSSRHYAKGLARPGQEPSEEEASAEGPHPDASEEEASEKDAD